MRSLFCSFSILFVLLVVGCSESTPEMDTSTVISPIGKKWECDHCKKEIANVGEEHLVTVRGNQYVICDEKCEADLKDWLSKQ
ncbi:MAG: TRASH domain-containing protein [Planctomycetaceae bacterium]|nr:TRASH domain-containing protein [Planctomycetaceae bacterium]